MENQEVVISLDTFLRIFKKYAVLIIVITILTTTGAYLYSNYLVEKQYSASAFLYFENKDMTVNSITSSENLATAQKLVANGVAIFTNSESIPRSVIDRCDLDISVAKLKSCINMEIVNQTQVLKITLTLTDVNLLAPVLNTYVEICLEEFERVVNSGTIKIINNATVSNKLAYPNTNQFIMIGFVIGAVGSYLCVLAKEFLDTKVKPDTDLFDEYGIPVFAEVVAFNSKLKGKYSYE